MQKSSQKFTKPSIHTCWRRTPIIDKPPDEVLDDSDDDEIGRLKKRVVDLEQKVVELETRLEVVEDLNLLAPYIAIFYTDVFRTLRGENFDQDGLRSFVYKTWVQLFSSAALEAQEYEDGTRESKPLNNMIADCMYRLAKITPEDWEKLQSVKRTRNLNSHPNLDDGKALEAIKLRWTKHEAYHPLQKVVHFVKQKPKSQRRFA